ncbi:hypothetical protein GFL39_14485 [Rhizobium leguminosarum bv. viciae]|nr:hypothetical protein [Rhizobium leguminosarum bv. viciae]NKL06116.1 hypothetical protein [Rhizobium leguminosarum bv. viciae]NKL83381.1 hypothetical protein [Rhizobium leguminosarum bv. viciae]NKL92314.1 hypothetical protein [Rhizobium leguminosarum bv. viciae]NKM92289.1 hypothetical protein [Rhizobium leguminosarum bv. viciae]
MDSSSVMEQMRSLWEDGLGSALQRRASFQTRKGRCNTLSCGIILSSNRSGLRNYAAVCA